MAILDLLNEDYSRLVSGLDLMPSRKTHWCISVCVARSDGRRIGIFWIGIAYADGRDNMSDLNSIFYFLKSAIFEM